MTKVIDFHTHTFPKKVSERILASISSDGILRYYTDGSVDGLKESMEKSGVSYSVNLPVMTRVDQVESVNNHLIRDKEELAKNGIITFGGLHPAYENYKEELKKLKNEGILGIKLHPAYQGMDLKTPEFMSLIDRISEAGMITVLHTGWDAGFLDHNYASVDAILQLIDQVHPEKLVLAHMGGWQAWKDVEQYIAGAPVYLDTAYSIEAVSIDPIRGKEFPFKRNMNEESFLRLVRKHGADQVLFATDSPWCDQKFYLDTMLQYALTEEEKEQIFWKNGAALLNL